MLKVVRKEVITCEYEGRHCSNFVSELHDGEKYGKISASCRERWKTFSVSVPFAITELLAPFH